MKVLFPLADREVDVEPDCRVSDACSRAGIPLDLVCGGNGTCGKCRVDVMECGRRESVLACQTPASDGMRVLVSPEAARHQLLETLGKGRFACAPAIREASVPAERLVTPMGSYDFSRLADLVEELAGVRPAPPSYDVLRRLAGCYRHPDAPFLDAILAGERIVDLVCAAGPVPIAGAAVDIGTTSVAMFLYDLATGELLGHASDLNAQVEFGADVISRIDHAKGGQQALADEQAAIERTVTGLLGRLCGQAGLATADVYEIAYCGNSTMQHLFCAFDPQPLGRMPFTGVIASQVVVPASALSIPINPRGAHVFMPLLGGFVGADTTACLLELPRDGRVRLTLDMGTNCEVALGSDDAFDVASTACGPALEGAGLSMGMRAVDGAIQHVDFADGRFVLDVIGGGRPKGLCGSGIVDAVAVLLRLGAINRKGAFLKGRRQADHPLGDRIRVDEERGRHFVLAGADEADGGREVVITLKDIRQVQLAKAAISTGCEILLRRSGMDPRDLAEVCLAGAFGSYISIPNAQAIGLLPDIEGVPVRALGNGAGLGVQRYLLSGGARDRAEAIRAGATHVELASDPSFTDVYLRSMTLGPSEMDWGRGA